MVIFLERKKIMIKTTLNFNVNNLLKMRDEKCTLVLDNPIQRGFVWSIPQISWFRLNHKRHII